MTLVWRSSPPSPTNNWEAFVRSAVTQSEPVRTGSHSLPAPRNLPLPCPLPERPSETFFSEYYIEDDVGCRIRVPTHCVWRDHKASPLVPMPNTCMGCKLGNACDKGWYRPGTRAIIVLRFRDSNGKALYGWYVRFRSAPGRLVALPKSIIHQIAARLPEQSDTAPESADLATFMDACRVVESNQSFHDLAIARCRRSDALVSTVSDKSVNTKKRKRKREALICPPASPAHTIVLGSCVVCMDENTEIATKCCGSESQTCQSCSIRMRGMCPVCEREKMNNTYQCLTCSAAVKLDDYGYPCFTCNASALCNECYAEHGECVECDPVRRAPCCGFV
jgi:hypothetical protein